MRPPTQAALLFRVQFTRSPKSRKCSNALCQEHRGASISFARRWCAFRLVVVDALQAKAVRTVLQSWFGPSPIFLSSFECSLTPPQSPVTIASCGDLLLPSSQYDAAFEIQAERIQAVLAPGPNVAAT
jgi:hypothetical protein